MSNNATVNRCWIQVVLIGIVFLCVALQAPLATAADNIRSIPNDTPCNAYPISSKGMHVVDFKTENLVSPQGIDVLNPRFSWKLVSQTLSEVQTAYQLVVTKSDGGEVVWDTGKIQSDKQLYIRYEGKSLEPSTEYFVELNVWNKIDQKSQIYATFSTGLFPTQDDPTPWKGKWIGLNSKESQPTSADISKSNWISFQREMNMPVCESVYRKSFDVENVDEVEVAIANIALDNRGEIFVNGFRVGGTDNYLVAATRDITQHLQNGKNVLAVHLWNVGCSPNPGGIVGAFYVRQKDGQKTEYPCDSSWKAIEGFSPDFLLSDFVDESWEQAFCIAKCGDAPWNEINVSLFDKPSPARYLSKLYMMKENVIVKRAVVYISGLGYNECYLNGVKLGDQICGPMFTDYDKSVPYQTYDATDVFTETRNIGANDIEISVILGNGRYYAPRIDKCVNYGEPCLLFQMIVEYEDGTKDIVVSDESWKGTDSGPISENNDYDGEISDGRAAIAVSSDCEHSFLKEGDNSRYLETRFGKSYVVETPFEVDIVTGPKGKMVAQMMPPMRKNMEIKPVSIKEMGQGRYILDFGQNFVGVPHLYLKGESGNTVQIRFAETLKENGELYFDNLRTALARDIYTMYGDPDGEIYEPRFTQHGGRYAELIGFPGVPDLNSVIGYTVTTDLPLIGSFETSNELINKIYHNIEWGTRGNYLSMPTDCPQRDERMGWQGDRAVGSKGEMYIFDNLTLYNKWMQDIEETQLEDGNVSDVAPAYWRLYSPNVTWPSAQFTIPESLYVMCGDDTSIVKHYDSRKKWLDFILSLCNEDGTISKDNYGDWCCPPESPELIHSQDPMRQTNRTLLATGYLINNLRISAGFAKLLNKSEDSKLFSDRADEMQTVFNKVFYNPDTATYDNGSQTSSVLPLAFGIAPEQERKRIFDALVDNIVNRTNYHLGTGLIGTQWINRLLSDMGRIDIPYAFATARDFPSWGYMVDKGATTVWELWNGDTADPAMNSGNHVMLVGDLVIWFYEYLAGIKADPCFPGFKRIIMRPNVVGDLTSVKASYDSASGMIVSSWKVEDGKFVWNVMIPANTTAIISAPTSNPESLVMRSTRLDLVPPAEGEIRFAKYSRSYFDFDLSSLEKRIENGRVEFELGSGAYEIVSEFK